MAKKILTVLLYVLVISLAIFGAICLIYLMFSKLKKETPAEPEVSLFVVSEPEFDVELLTINEYSRPGLERETVKNIVVHYTANPGTTAKQNRDYFEGLKDTNYTKASCHFLIGLDGEIIQCIPTSEVAYGVGGHENFTTISIEVCHPDDTGVFNASTYDSLVHATAWLCGKFDLTAKDVIRHFDITEKNCPKYYVENPDEWDRFIEDVSEFIDTYGEPKFPAEESSDE